MNNVVRVEKIKGFTTVANAPFNDSRLSWEARGMLAYLLTKPDSWEVRMGDLISQSPGSRTIVRRIFKELETYGYLTRERQRQENGTFRWLTTIREKSNQGTKTTGGSTTDGKPADVLKTDVVSTEKIAGTPPADRPKPEKKGDLLDGMIHYAQKNQGKPDLGFLQEHLRPMAAAFCEVAGKSYYPLKPDQSLWRKTFAEWYARGFKPDQVQAATRAHVSEALSIKGPQSIEYKIKELIENPVRPDVTTFSANGRAPRNITAERLAQEQTHE